MKLQDVTHVLEGIAPTRYAESWDNVGLIVGDPAAEVTRVLLAIDVTRDVADEAIEGGYNLVMAYHPPVFEGLKRVTAGSLVWRAIQHELALYSPHTALDVAAGGTNDVLADILGMDDRAPARITRPEEGVGLGRVGSIRATSREELFERIRRELGVERLLVAGPVTGTITRAAVGAGACGDLIKDVIAARAELYLTGELRHHDALRAASVGMTVVCALHSNSERCALARLAERLRGTLVGVTVDLSKRDRDPFTIF